MGLGRGYLRDAVWPPGDPGRGAMGVVLPGGRGSRSGPVWRPLRAGRGPGGARRRARRGPAGPVGFLSPPPRVKIGGISRPGVRRGGVHRRVNGDRGAKNPLHPLIRRAAPGRSACPPTSSPPTGSFFLYFSYSSSGWGEGVAKFRKVFGGYERCNGVFVPGASAADLPKKVWEVAPPTPPGSNPMNVDTIRLEEGGGGNAG